MPPNPNSNPTKNKAKTLLKSLLSTTSSTFNCGGCGNRRHPNLHDVHLPLPKPQPPSPPSLSTTTTSDLAGCTSTTFDDYDDEADPQPSRDPTFSTRLGDTLAVVKDSDDPYLDFKNSMLQMIFDKEIFNKQDLQDLLACFLRLNSPSHHAAVIRAFSDIWRAVMSPAPEIDTQVRCSTKCPKEEG